MSEAQEGIPLREYVDTLLNAERELREAKFLSVAELAEKHNDLIREMERRDERYLTEDTYQARHEEVVRRVTVVENRVSVMEGGNAIKASTVGWLLAGMTVVLGIVVVIINLLTGQ